MKLLSEQTRIRSLIMPAAVIALPAIAAWKLWAPIWAGEQSRGWDGTGHYAIAQLYDQTIFPNTFGRTNAYFGGMPFPNFYPPVFYWCVALLHKTRLFSFATAFKLVLILPVLLMPLTIWWLAWRLSNKNRLVATAASLASVVLLIDVRFMGSVLAGLDYFSTFQIGLYTQPLGFVLMIAWFVVYSRSGQTQTGKGAGTPRTDTLALQMSWVALTAVMLALTVLSNFFNAITASVFILTKLGTDLFQYWRAIASKRAGQVQNLTGERKTQASDLAKDLVPHETHTDSDQAAAVRNFSLHLLSPVVAALLAAFWIIPMLTEYSYFVTRPYVPETQSLFSPWLMSWYVAALIGIVIWGRALAGKSEHIRKAVPEKRKKRQYNSRIQTTSAAHAGTSVNTRAGLLDRGGSWAMVPYLVTCLILAVAIVFSSTLAPSWFPLQAPRFLATLTFLLAVPVGITLSTVFSWLARLLGEVPQLSFKSARYSSGIALVMFLILVLSAPAIGWAYAFYPKGKTPIDDVLEFGRQHGDGRYLVEVINPKLGPAWTEASFDARAINSYLGAQGNETISGVFHEASPNALFTLPLVNAFSNYPDSFGVSSVLADDLDFAAEPLSEQIKRAQFLGVKYLAIRTPAMKERVSKEVTTAIRHDIGWWAVFELSDPPVPKIQALPYKPALVLSSFTVKARRRNEMNFLRLAEEQFVDNWFDVLLARSGESKIDRLNELDKFGALILDTYDYGDETAAFERLRKFAQDHALVCLSADSPLFRRIQNSRAQFPLLQIVDRQLEESGEAVEALKPTYHYNSSSIRQQWRVIRSILEQTKISTSAASTDVTGEVNQTRIDLVSNKIQNAGSTPVLIGTTFHPNWDRSDGYAIYAATPFLMVTFVDQKATIKYERHRLDEVALWISAGALVAVCLLMALRFPLHKLFG